MEVGEFGKLKIGAIIQARFDSTRFPGKVLRPLPFDSKETVLSQINNRLLKVEEINDVIVATSDEESDDIIVEYCKKNNLICERGSKNNVLSRFVDVAKKRKFDVIIRITGDNPILLIDILEIAIKKHIKEKVDYTRNLNLPYGTSFEIVNSNILEDILLNKKISDSDKEHVTIFIKNNRGQYKIQELNHDLPPINFRFTVDYPSDYAAMNILFQHLNLNSCDYKYDTLRNFVLNNPWLNTINAGNLQKRSFATLKEELVSAIELLESLDYKKTVELLKKQ